MARSRGLGDVYKRQVYTISPPGQCILVEAEGIEPF
jgi:hypothetical protein